MANVKPSDVWTPVVRYLGFTDASEVADAFNKVDTCPLCIECGGDDHDPEMCLVHIEHMVDILGHSGEYDHLFKEDN